MMVPRHAARRSLRIVVDLPANQLGPGWRKRAEQCRGLAAAGLARERSEAASE